MGCPKEDILFSIVIPVYNTDKELLDRCIQSIKALTYQNYECVMVDDGSVKECAKRLDDIVASDERFRVIHIEHVGNSAGRNIGMDEAGGDYLMFVDSDDVICPFALEEAYSIIREYRCEMVIGLSIRFFKGEDPGFAEGYDGKNKLIFLNGREKIKSYVNQILGYRNGKYDFGKAYLSGGPVSRVCKTSIMQRSRFPEGDLMTEDVVWNLMLASKVSSIVITTNIWYAYLHYSGSKSRSFYRDAREKFTLQVRAYWSYCKKYWPDCDKGLCTKLWVEIALFFRIYLGHPDNLISWRDKYRIYKDIFEMPEYIEMMKNIDFSYDTRKLMRIAKEATLFLMKHKVFFPTWFVWKKAGEKSL